MDNQENIRNISIIGHINHGKTTFFNTLLLKAGIASTKINDLCQPDTSIDLMECPTTLKSKHFSLCFRHDTAYSNDSKHKQ